MIFIFPINENGVSIVLVDDDVRLLNIAVVSAPAVGLAERCDSFAKLLPF